MSAELLREAADRLDALADATTTPDAMRPYGDRRLPSQPVERWPDMTRGYLGGEWGDYCAALSPTVGKAIAAWLRDAAHDGDDFEQHSACAVARAILGRDA